jgi:predicted AAA+ superfamily ATPase
MNQEVLRYVQKQLAVTGDKLTMLTHDRSGKAYPERYLFSKLSEYVTEFSEHHSENRWVIIPGLRGVGKTTLMAQLIVNMRNDQRDIDILFVSLDEVVDVLKAGLSDVLEAYEQILGMSYEKLKKPVFLFIDEVQTDSGWAGILKVLHGKTKNVFIVCSGSSAVSLQMSADSARRAIVEKLYPMSFGEYEMVKHGVVPTIGLAEEIRSAIYFSSSAEEVYEKLKRLESLVNKYWSKIDRLDIKQYLMTGTLPFALNLKDSAQVFDAISLLLDKVIAKDIVILGKFDTKTLATIKRLLLVLAEGEVVSLNKLEQLLFLNRLTIAEILDVLEKAELLIKVPAHGANVTVVKKPAKYLFMSPAIRMTFFSIAGIESTLLSRQGRLLEDAVVARYHREFLSGGMGSVSYDSSEGGSDFIFRIANKIQIAVEVGIGKKDAKQTAKTMKHIKCDYGIVLSQKELGLDKTDKNIVMVPLDYFLLM